MLKGSKGCCDKSVTFRKSENFRFLGKQFVLLLNNLIETGHWDISILSDNFDFGRWKKTLKDDAFKESCKEDIVKLLDDFILWHVQEFMDELKLDFLLNHQRRQFHQFRSFLVKNSRSHSVFKRTPKLLKMLENFACGELYHLYDNTLLISSFFLK